MPAAALPSDKPITLPRLSGLGWVAIALIAIGLIRAADTLPGAWGRNDFAHYYLSARAKLEGQRPYTTSLEPLCEELGFEFDPRIVAGTNPPALNLLVAGFAWLPPLPAYVLWMTLQVTCLAGLLAMLMRHTADSPGEPWQWLAVGVVLNSTAVWSCLHYSQVQLLIALLIASGFFLRKQRRGCAACVAVSLATALKIYPAALLPWFILSGEGGWRGVRSRLLTSAAVGLAAFVLSGPLDWFDFAVHGLSTVQNSVAVSTSNYSLQSAASLLTGAVVGRPVPAEVLDTALWASRLASVALFTVFYLLIWLRRLPDSRAIGLLTVAMLLASPVCWSHYLVLMILPAWLVTADAFRGPASVGVWLLAAMGTLCVVSELDAPVPLGQIGLARTALHLYPTAVLAGFAAGLLVVGRGVGVGPGRVSA